MSRRVDRVSPRVTPVASGQQQSWAPADAGLASARPSQALSPCPALAQAVGREGLQAPWSSGSGFGDVFTLTEGHRGRLMPCTASSHEPVQKPHLRLSHCRGPVPRPLPRPARTPGPTLGTSPRTALSGRPLASILPHGPRSGPLLLQLRDLHVLVPFLCLASARSRSTVLGQSVQTREPACLGSDPSSATSWVTLGK